MTIELKYLINAEEGSLVDFMPLINKMYRVYSISKSDRKVENAVLVQEALVGEDEKKSIDIVLIEGKGLRNTIINEDNENFREYSEFLGRYN